MWKQIWPIIIHEKHKKILGNFSLFRLHSEPFRDFNEYGMKNVETSGMNLNWWNDQTRVKIALHRAENINFSKV